MAVHAQGASCDAHCSYGEHDDGRSRLVGRGGGLLRVLVSAAGFVAAHPLRARHSLHRLRCFALQERTLQTTVLELDV